VISGRNRLELWPDGRLELEMNGVVAMAMLQASSVDFEPSKTSLYDGECLLVLRGVEEVSEAPEKTTKSGRVLAVDCCVDWGFSRLAERKMVQMRKSQLKVEASVDNEPLECACVDAYPSDRPEVPFICFQIEICSFRQKSISNLSASPHFKIDFFSNFIAEKNEK
jgi:hypothetical protein